MTLETNIKEALLDIGTDYKTFKTWLFGSTVGSLAALNTSDKTSIVAAINELKANAGSGGAAVQDATSATKGIVRFGTIQEQLDGLSETIAATPAGLKAVAQAVKSELLGGADPAWDTLQELKALVDSAEESDTITALTQTVGNKIDASAIGNPEADLAAYYAAAKA
jgi:hypothetical protein